MMMDWKFWKKASVENPSAACVENYQIATNMSSL